MMRTARRWRCPDCAHVIKQAPDEPLPNHCVACGSYLWDEEDEPFVPKAPRIRNKALINAVDDVYYGMEDATKARAELMAQHTPGASASDFSHTLITDMNDRQKPGDVAWRGPAANDVTRQMDFLRQRGGNVGFGGSGVPNYEPAIPLTGDATRQKMSGVHHQLVRELVGGGQIGSYRGRK